MTDVTAGQGKRPTTAATSRIDSLSQEEEHEIEPCTVLPRYFARTRILAPRIQGPIGNAKSAITPMFTAPFVPESRALLRDLGRHSRCPRKYAYEIERPWLALVPHKPL